MESSCTGVWDAKKVKKYWRDQLPERSGEAFTDPYFPPNQNSLMARDSNGH
jgi:hypothetical protein